CRAIGVLEIEQTSTSRTRERNDRLVVLPVKAPREIGVRSVFDLPDRWRAELEQFFLAAAAFEGKALRVLGWAGSDDADDLVRRSLATAADEENDRAGQIDRRAAHRR